MVSKDSVQKELEQVLASVVFNGKKQAGRFLRYIVTETLEGRGDRITQYGIAVEALGKATDYCPTESPAVRVEAGRIRKLLEEYYASEGSSSHCRIDLPVGGYTPVFRKPEIANPQCKWLGEKRVQSTGPKVCFVCQNPAIIRDDSLRNLLYHLRSNMLVVLSKLHTIQIALADPGSVPAHHSGMLDYAWRRHHAEFLLQCEAQPEGKHFKLHYVLTHTQTQSQVWAGEFLIASSRAIEALDETYETIGQEVFSLHRGVALAFWSRYWLRYGYMPAPYEVMVAHVRYLQEEMSEQNFRLFWEACCKRTQQYHDDALAHLHHSIACLYAYMLKADVNTHLDILWQQRALMALELNPGNAMAHSIFALNCFHRGESELGKVEIETARQSDSFDTTCGLLLSVGLCALRHWDRACYLLKEVVGEGLYVGFPDPLRSIPCLFYHRQGHYIVLAETPGEFPKLGGWEGFGELVNYCQSSDCKSCLKGISRVVDQACATLPLRSNSLTNSHNTSHSKPQSVHNHNAVVI